MYFITDLSARLSLFFLWRGKRNGDVERQRKHLDKFLKRHAERYPFSIAYDAKLMLAEDRCAEAMARFQQCQDVLPNDETSDTLYVRLFCRFFDGLAMGHSDRELQEIRKLALSLEIDPLIGFLLTFPTEEEMSESIRRAGRQVVHVDASIDF